MKYMVWILVLIAFATQAQTSNECDNNRYRAWWDVQKYTLTIDFGKLDGHIEGTCVIGAKVLTHAADSIQIDLNQPLIIKDIAFKGKTLDYIRKGNVFMVIGNFSKLLTLNEEFDLHITYEGSPEVAKNPPWSGGFIITKDSNDKAWLSVACQSEGSSVWFPCKNYQGDEAGEVTATYIVPRDMVAVGNGRLINQGVGINQQSKSGIFTWQTKNVINNYNITFYIGDYVHWSDTVMGVSGDLTLDYYVLRQNQQKALRHFKEVPKMMNCFEEKLGPYPFYEDGYKILEAPFLGMEHQSAIAYGNNYLKGYLGSDRSGSGAGLMFDYIIIHESAHEWFGNSITAADRADNWIHEGFASYAETIFAECLLGKEEAYNYQIGKLKLIKNIIPVQGVYNTCDDGSTDNYYKAAQMIHMIRMIMQNDHAFWGLMRAINQEFYHKLIKSSDIEDFISKYLNLDLSAFFDQYLRQHQLPELELRDSENGILECRYVNCVEGFNMPLDILVKDRPHRIFPTSDWTSIGLEVDSKLISESSDFLVTVKFPEEELR